MDDTKKKFLEAEEMATALAKTLQTCTVKLLLTRRQQEN